MKIEEAIPELKSVKEEWELVENTMADYLLESGVNDHFHEDTIICPYCDCEYDDYDFNYSDEGDYTIECPICKKKFDLEVEEVRYFSTKRNVDEMPEDWGDEE